MLDIDKNETDIHSLFLYPLKYQNFILNQNCQVKFGIIFLQICGSMDIENYKEDHLSNENDISKYFTINK